MKTESARARDRKKRGRIAVAVLTVGLVIMAWLAPEVASASCQFEYEWHPLSVPSPQIPCALAYDKARREVVLFGGLDNDTPGQTWTFDGNDWTQKFPAHSPPSRRGHKIVYDEGRGIVVLF